MAKGGLQHKMDSFFKEKEKEKENEQFSSEGSPGMVSAGQDASWRPRRSWRNVQSPNVTPTNRRARSSTAERSTAPYVLVDQMYLDRYVYQKDDRIFLCRLRQKGGRQYRNRSTRQARKAKATTTQTVPHELPGRVTLKSMTLVKTPMSFS